MRWINFGSVALLALLHCLSLDNAWAVVLNNPYPEKQAKDSIYYASFDEQPKTLDPAKSYASNEYTFIAQIYEPVLTYDYLIRPYTLAPLTATQMPLIQFLDANKKPISEQSAASVAYTVYTLSIKPGVYYQPHPALAKNKQGQYRYLHLNNDYLEQHAIHKLSDFKHTGTRELIADDYIYQIKRLANPRVSSPIYGLMREYIVGFKEYAASLPQHEPGTNNYIDLRKYSLSGLRKIDDYHYQITLKGQYAQFIFWLATTFFSPIPWEADLFYAQPNMEQKNLTLAWYPIGTGAFMLTQNNPNRMMVLQKNPNFAKQYFPENGTENDRKDGYLANTGKVLPLIDKAIYTLEKEAIPRWNKFLQGYYDNSGVSADSFDQAIRISSEGQAQLSNDMLDKGIYLTQSASPTIFYIGFNMLNKVVGGDNEKARKLRQAISIAINIDEEIAIFYNGRGIAAQGPIPPGIFGYREGKEGVNPYVYQWVDNHYKRRPLADAKQLMAEAGYANGIDPATGKNLILHYDVSTSGGPEDKPRMNWMRKQFAAIGISLNVRATLYNRFQEKMRSGNTQIFAWGWEADYPDPENFLFQLYSQNGKAKFGGENTANYSNPKYDRLFLAMKNLPDNEQRQQIIDKMMAIVRYDAPWVWGRFPKDFLLSQSWVSKIKPMHVNPGTLKYVAVDVAQRNKLRLAWNQPILLPLIGVFLLLLILVIPLWMAYSKKEKQPALRKNSE